MKNIVCIFLLVSLFSFCQEKSEKVEIVIDDGVEVVLNRIEPYKIKDEPATFALEKEFDIDFERVELAELGIGEIQGFEVDSKGNIYCISELQIFKFDDSGKFIRKFGEKGQGPGEIGYPLKWWITESDSLALYDYGNNKFLFFDENGDFSREIKIPSAEIRSYGPNWIAMLDNGNSFFQDSVFDREADMNEHHLTVLDSDFKKKAVLRESVLYENPFKSARINLIRSHILSCFNRDNIYATCQQNQEFQINIYNLEGDLIRQVRKEYRKTGIPKTVRDNKIEEYMNSTPYRVHKMAGYFPEHYPPIKNIYVDNQGQIFAETYEEGETNDEEMVDFFTEDGVYTGRTSLKKAISRIFKNDRLYATYEKESGYQILSIYKIRWQN